MYDIINCLPGLVCYPASVYPCAGGYYCPTPFLWQTGEIPCPEGSFCPRGQVAPIPCGFLDSCDYGSRTRTQFVGALFAGIAVVLFVIIFAVCKLVELRHRVKWERERKSFSSGISSQDPETVEEARPLLSLSPITPINIEFNNLKVAITLPSGEEKTILSHASGHCLAGQVTAVLGGSGAGKTTLVDAILGKITLKEGSTKISGTLGTIEASKIGYVPQHDTLIDTLTVREVIEHSARVRLPSSWTSSQRKQQVDSVIESLGLQGVEYSIIGNESAGRKGISGGQRKRVSIGLELVANPSVLVLDECTTGLDATSSLELMKCLQRIAHQGGRTVLAIIHQPRYEIFEQTLDNVVLLTRGRVVFSGTPEEATKYFSSIGYVPPETCNPAEFLLDVISVDNNVVTQLAARWEETRLSRSVSEASPKESSSILKDDIGCASIWVQILAAAYRHLLQKYRSPFSFIIFVVVHILVGVILGAGFLQAHGIFLPPMPAEVADLCPQPLLNLCQTEPIDWMSLRLSAFYLSLALGTGALISAVFTFGSEFDVLKREVGSGISSMGLFIGKNLAEIPWIVVGPMIFGATYVPLLRPDSGWLEQYGIFLGVEFASYGLGYFLSMVFPVGSAHVIGVVVVFAFSICSGISPKLRVVRETMGVLQFFWDISFPLYAVEASVAAEAKYWTTPGTAFAVSTQRFATEYGFQLDSYWRDLASLAIIGLLFRLLAGVIFWLSINPKPRNKIVRAKTAVTIWITGLLFISTPTAVSAVNYPDNGVCNVCSNVLFPICDCPLGFYCSNETRPMCDRCPVGFYCPVPGDTPPLACPTGYWCPENTYVPVECPFGAICTPERAYYILGPLVALGLVLTLALLYLWNKKRTSKVIELRSVRSIQESEREPLLEESASSGFEISLSGVSVEVGRKIPLVPSSSVRTLLSDVTGVFPRSQLIAVMGPSGSGKTTMLNVLRGSLSLTRGSVEVNGVRCKRGLKEFKGVIGMVPQDDDTVDPQLTVEEALLHSARLRLSRELTDMERKMEVDRTLEALSLQEVRERFVGTGSTGSNSRGVSGGQRKRVNIGVEMVAKPSILLLDEPTSGLDSHAAASVVERMRHIAHHQSVTVISTIHQPSQQVFELFDTLVILVGGKVAYWGPAKNAISYLSNATGQKVPARIAAPDYILDVVSGSGGELLSEKWKTNEEDSKIAVPVEEGARTKSDSKLLKSRLRRSVPLPPIQFFVQLLRQSLRTARTLFSSILLSCLIYAFTGAYLGLPFTSPKYVLPVPGEITDWCPGAARDMTSSNKWLQPCNDGWPSAEVQGLAAMYFCMGLGTLTAAFSVWTFGGDRYVFWREARSGVNTLSYFLAANLIDAVKCAMFALCFVSAYFLVAAPYGAFSEYYILSFCFVLTNYGLGYVFSALLAPSEAAIVATLTALVAGVTSGFVFQYAPVWPWYYGEGLFRSEATFVVEHATVKELGWVREYADLQYGYRIENNTIQLDSEMMLAYAGGFRLLSYLLMVLRMPA